MRWRKFIALACGAVMWPALAYAQQPDGLRRIGALFGLTETDSEGQARIAALKEGLQKLGWIEGSNLKIDYRWAGGHTDQLRRLQLSWLA